VSRRWSKLKKRVEALWSEDLPMAIHCNVFTKTYKEFTFDEPRHWIVLGGRVIWDFPGPFLKPSSMPGREPRAKPEPRGEWLDYWESGYGSGYGGLAPSTPSFLMETWIDRPRDQLMVPIEEDRWELTDLLRAADRRLGRGVLLAWGEALDTNHPALTILRTRFRETLAVLKSKTPGKPGRKALVL
jgi:hypothetical protein